MLSATHPQRDLTSIFNALEQKKIRVSLWEVRSGRKYLRFSPHFHNIAAELDAALAALSA